MDTLELFRFLRSEHPNFNMKCHAYRSGAVAIDIITMNGVYVVEYFPKIPNEIGVSNAKNATFGFEGCDEVFSNIEDTKFYLNMLLQRTMPPEDVYGEPIYAD